MKKYIITGGNNLKGAINISGTKNVVLKALVAACLTEEEVEITNIPLITDFYIMVDIVRMMGGEVNLIDHKVKVSLKNIKDIKIPLEMGAKIRTSSMFLSPLLLRAKKAIIPNPGGCRIGARDIDRHIKGLEQMGAKIEYNHDDGYFYASTQGLKGTHYRFEKSTHTGTETLILAATKARGRTILENAATEPEIDDLINLLNKMGARVKREQERTIIIDGVEQLHGASIEIMSDRNELVTFAIASCLTGGQITINNAQISTIKFFLDKLYDAGIKWSQDNGGLRFYVDSKLRSTDVITSSHPGFMTDWQGPWAVLMTQANGDSSIHETVYENRFGYVEELKKMGAEIEFYNPKVENPKNFYSFNYDENNNDYQHAIKIHGKTLLHNAVLKITDLRAGATLVLASLIAKGESIIFGAEHLERGYERFDERLRSLGANIKVIEEYESTE